MLVLQCAFFHLAVYLGCVFKSVSTCLILFSDCTRLHCTPHSIVGVLWAISSLLPLQIMWQWASFYVHLWAFARLFLWTALFENLVGQESASLLDFSKLPSDRSHQPVLPQTVQCSFSSCPPSTPGLAGSQTLKWSISALAQDIWKHETYPSIDPCQQTEGRKHRAVN